MLEPSIDPEFEAFAARVEEATPRHPRVYLGDEFLYVALGICFAGALYPVVVVIGAAVAWSATFVMQLLNSSRTIPGISELLGLVMVPIIAAVFGLIGFAWAALVTVFVLPVFFLIAKSLRLTAYIVWLGAGCGGLVGILAVTPLWLDAGQRFNSTLGALFVLAIGPGLSTILGQAGGAWGGNHAQLRRQSWIEWEKVIVEAGGWGPTAADTANEELATDEETRPPVFQFRIWHLLWISVWLSVLLTAMRLVGIPLEIALPVMGVWIVYQAFTLFIGGRIVRWNLRRRAGIA